MQITSNEIRQKYIDFFKTKNHAIIPSASVVPENDPTVLFNTAWMQPLVPYLLWEKHPLWKRLADYQKCIRTNDIDDVWDNTHLTFFEMLWNWSLWDYFKKESISWSYEFLTSKEWLWIDPKKLAVTVFEWDENAPRDEESLEIWKSLWFHESKISFMWAKDNWWAAWPTWPCWPDTEIFFYVWEWFPDKNSNVKNDEKNWMEIWNNVFMEFNKLEDWNLVKLPAKNVDTWMGLERITRTLTHAPSVYETDVFNDIIEAASKKIWVDYNDENKKSLRIIADHTRTSTMMLSDWILPSNVDQWYVLRRLLRRSIREAYKLWYKDLFLSDLAGVVIKKFENIYTHIKEKKDLIISDISKEEKQFWDTLEKWLKEFDKLVNWFKIAFERTGQKVDTISWDKAFKLYDTFGFPIEMTRELAEEKWLNVDIEWFNDAFKKHQELSRSWAEQKFKWWLADTSETTTALHSATHLMLAWLRKVLWNHVHQAWSNITSERLRFDFTNEDKVTPEQLQEVENYVNKAINANANVILEEINKDDAKAAWVEWSFWEKYPDIVKVYTFKSNSWEIFSRELCGWPHVEATGTMWKFKILKEEASSRWVRRIKAILEK